jgi:hypothetical protein
LLRDARRATWILIVPAQTFIEPLDELARTLDPEHAPDQDEPDPQGLGSLEDRLTTAVLVLWAFALLGWLCYLAYAF